MPLASGIEQPETVSNTRGRNGEALMLHLRLVPGPGYCEIVSELQLHSVLPQAFRHTVSPASNGSTRRNTRRVLGELAASM